MIDVIEEAIRSEEKIARETISEEVVKRAIAAETAAIERKVVGAAAIETAVVETAADETAETAAADSKIPVIRIENLYKIYRADEARVYTLNSVDFTMYKGEFCAIVDPSDSGKSILLSMLAGLERLSKGETIIGKTYIEKLEENELVVFQRRQVGFTFRSYNLLQTLNTVESMALPLFFRGVSEKEHDAIAKKYLKEVGPEKQMKHMANAMSDGQQQRVGIARALVIRPQIIFVDEPTRSLDTKTTQEVLKLARRVIQERNQILVMVTHDNYVAPPADRQFYIVDRKVFKVDERHHDEEEEIG